MWETYRLQHATQCLLAAYSLISNFKPGLYKEAQKLNPGFESLEEIHLSRLIDCYSNFMFSQYLPKGAFEYSSLLAAFLLILILLFALAGLLSNGYGCM